MIQGYKSAELRAYVESMLSKDKSGHDYSHIQRVESNAKEIIKNLSSSDTFDSDILEASILLHDIDYRTPSTHHIDSANFALENLHQWGVDLATAEKVHHAIINHNRVYAPPIDPVEKLSLEAKILYDADNIDALGSIGIVRMTQFSTSRGWPLSLPGGKNEVNTSLYGNIKHLLTYPGLMLTPQGKDLAIERTKILQQFLDQLSKELGL